MPSSRRQKASERRLRAANREKEDALARRAGPVLARPCARALGGADARRSKLRGVDMPHASAAASQPRVRALGTERERRGNPLRATLFESARRVGQERLRQQESRAGTDGRQLRRPARRQESRPARCRARRTGGGTGPRRHPRSAPTTSSDGRVPWRSARHFRHQRREAGILALGERRLDAAAGVIQHAHLRHDAARQPLGARATGRA